MTDRRRWVLAAVVLGLMFAWCLARVTPPAPARRIRVATGEVRLLTASPTGRALAWLSECTQQGDGWRGCRVHVHDLENGRTEDIGGGGSTTVPLRWSARGELATLVDLGPDGRTGTLRLWPGGGGVARVAEGVSDFVFGPEGELLYVANGTGFVRTGAGTVTIRGAQALRSIAPNPVSGTAAGAIALSEGGDLLAVDTTTGSTRSVARDVANYAFSASGRYAVALTTREAGGTLLSAPLESATAPVRLGLGIASFRAAPVGDAVAFVKRADDKETLHVGELETGETEELATAPGLVHGWAAKAQVLAWIATSGSRELGVVRVGEPPRRVAEGVHEFALSGAGARISFARATGDARRPRELVIAHTADPAEQVHVAFGGCCGLAFLPGEQGAVFRGNCDTKWGPLFGSCGSHKGPYRGQRYGGMVSRFALAPLPADGLVRVIAEEQPPAFGSRAQTSELVAAVSEDRYLSVDVDVDVGTVIFLPPDASRIAYYKSQPEEAGVYVAEIGSWGRPCALGSQSW